jgi:hypothetical protein
MIGLVTMPKLASSSVCPSGAAFATAAVPIAVAPPGLFETTTPCRQSSVSLGANSRA